MVEKQYDTVQCVIEKVRTYDAFYFTIHDENSQFEPSQKIMYLGFVVNSEEMTVRLTEERGQKLLFACKDLLRQTKSKTRSVASCIGLMVSSFAGCGSTAWTVTLQSA